MLNVLFVCVENACRSQLAEQISNRIYGDKIFAQSAGSQPAKTVNPKAIDSLKRIGIIFDEIQPYLMELLESLNDSDVWLFPTLRTYGTSIDKPFKDIIKKAGHQPWPAICNNMRTTRANEVEREFGKVALIFSTSL